MENLKHTLIIITSLFIFSTNTSHAFNPGNINPDIPRPEYVTQKTIKKVCNIGNEELLGCINFKQNRILIYWKVQANPILDQRIYWHEVGHWLTKSWHREDYITKLGYEDTIQNDIMTMGERIANEFELYKIINIKHLDIFKDMDKIITN